MTLGREGINRFPLEVEARQQPTYWQNVGNDVVNRAGTAVLSIFVAIRTFTIGLEDRMLPRPLFPNWILRFLKLIKEPQPQYLSLYY